MNQPFNASYVGHRADVVSLLMSSGTTLHRVLDVGSATGEVGAYVKRQTGAIVDAVEMVPEMAAVAATKLDNVFVGTAEEFVEKSDPALRYDAILLADVLEHTADPWALLAFFRSRLTPTGVVVISLPNIRHWSTIFNLTFRGDWPHRDRGIHDRTHLRFFTLKTMRELIESAGLKIDRMNRNLRIDEGFGRINKYSGFTNLPGLRSFFTFQYLFLCSAA
ncbi:class I SAM-dependent methyltransferase [Sphingobium nicotianae]|uniref:Class I SAM-dependent methyltransferase n=1 Tax=Sphingobium nicotianae TaxID=2782607 RepID=A0A9X1DEK6_9SPHN|nr:class I SAM-dependent methyltransferase [Sphingobium nicotianae]MBT2188495.1 class I SAM-dependent methyltransferase [Sphingobium nicotianae]